MSDPIPVTVVGGYLGAGKTTLVNHLLRHAGGLRFAVLVNDFGELPVDADLIESREEELISIAGGCVCCSFGSDLIAALMRLPERAPHLEQVLVETSGVALPAAVARSVALLPAYRLDGTIVLADAETVRARAADRYLGDTVARQLADADLVVLNKIDLVRPEELARLSSWMRDQVPQARLVCAQRAQVPPEVILGSGLSVTGSGPRSWMESGKIASAVPLVSTNVFASFTCRPEHPLDVALLGTALSDPALGVLRAKGRLRHLDGSWKTLQVVGSRCEISPARPSGNRAVLVCIGLTDSLERRPIESAIARARQRQSAP